MTKPAQPLVVYYNSACPVCDAGIKSQKGQMQHCPVQWVDVHSQPQAVDDLGVGLETVRERLHVRDEQGHLVVGASALATLWAATPGQGWLAWLVRKSGPLGRGSYNLFARLLYQWNRRRQRWVV